MGKYGIWGRLVAILHSPFEIGIQDPPNSQLRLNQGSHLKFQNDAISRDLGLLR